MRLRTRDAYDPDQLAVIYPTPHNHTRWADHCLRVAVTTEIARWLGPFDSVADLSCGDGAIARSLGAPETILGDLAPGHPLCGPVEETIQGLRPVDLFICTETLEHVNDPDWLLRTIRSKARCAVFSTPDAEAPDANAEHYWTWDTDDVESMLTDAGWEVAVGTVLWLPAYRVRYQIWGCR